jgi:uncharacterized protein YdeI (YjbR/CyaY-like superfamily)
MNPHFFRNPAEFREWLLQHHETATELIVGYYKVKSGKESMTWSQSVDEALCFGWIDGIRRSINEESYCIRFTPRRPGSSWSQVNIMKVNELTRKGLMMAAGKAAFSARKIEKSGIYSYENAKVRLDQTMEKQFRVNKKAWNYYESQAPHYRKLTMRWVMGAKQEATRLKRLNELINASEAGEWIRAMRFGKDTPHNK